MNTYLKDLEIQLRNETKPHHDKIGLSLSVSVNNYLVLVLKVIRSEGGVFQITWRCRGDVTDNDGDWLFNPAPVEGALQTILYIGPLEAVLATAELREFLLQTPELLGTLSKRMAEEPSFSFALAEREYLRFFQDRS